MLQQHGSNKPAGGADEILDYLEVVHVFVRRSHAGGSALLEVG